MESVGVPLHGGLDAVGSADGKMGMHWTDTPVIRLKHRVNRGEQRLLVVLGTPLLRGFRFGRGQASKLFAVQCPKRIFNC